MFNERVEQFFSALKAVKKRRGIPEDRRERRAYLADVLEPVTKALLAAVNAFGFPYRDVAEHIAKSDLRDNAYDFAKEYLWWLAHLDPTFTDLRDRFARETAVGLVSCGKLKEPKPSAFTGVGELFQCEHRTLRAYVAQLCFLILEEVEDRAFGSDQYWWRVACY